MSPSKGSNVNFFADGVNQRVRNAKKLKRFISSLFKKEKTSLQSINYVFCTDNQLRIINRNYLNHDYFTDIITFNFSPKKEPIVAEVYISIDRVKENAKNFGVTYTKELHRVIFHGALHLCGYKDKTKDEKRIMRAQEGLYLDLYFV